MQLRLGRKTPKHRPTLGTLPPRSVALSDPAPLAAATAPYPDGCWITRADMLTILGALHDAALYDAMYGKPANFGRYKALARALGDDR